VRSAPAAAISDVALFVPDPAAVKGIGDDFDDVPAGGVAGVAHGCPLPLSLIHITEPTRRTPSSYAVFCFDKKRDD